MSETAGKPSPGRGAGGRVLWLGFPRARCCSTGFAGLPAGLPVVAMRLSLLRPAAVGGPCGPKFLGYPPLGFPDAVRRLTGPERRGAGVGGSSPPSGSVASLGFVAFSRGFGSVAMWFDAVVNCCEVP